MYESAVLFLSIVMFFCLVGCGESLAKRDVTRACGFSLFIPLDLVLYAIVVLGS